MSFWHFVKQLANLTFNLEKYLPFSVMGTAKLLIGVHKNEKKSVRFLRLRSQCNETGCKVSEKSMKSNPLSLRNRFALSSQAQAMAYSLVYDVDSN